MKTAKKAQAVAAPEFHYYGSTVYDWITGPSRDDVLKKLASYNLTGLKSLKKAGRAGIECVVCKVLLPPKATYRIRNYVPFAITEKNAAGDLVATTRRVPLREYERLIITDGKGTAILNPELEQISDERLIEDDSKPITKAEMCWY